MSFLCPAHLMVEPTRALACSALPDAPVEPDRVRTRRRHFTFFRALFTKPVRLVDQCAARQA
jgi:hypothetical protein